MGREIYGLRALAEKFGVKESTAQYLREPDEQIS